ncbi:MAG: dTDP-glucose 4,6-dehydratase [Candidatus Caenarcaniphilales bacterium]|jgi:dTDP-glucose 4,6-dehydratase|nr:dTDP-glucose 4,6-dehydratase [Candidatus Caenarcaniphilales bacterium]
MEKILITGGNGFIGTNFIHLLYETYPDLEIFNLDCLDFKITADNHKHLDAKRYHHIHASLLDKDVLNDLFAKNKFSQVINFAAKSHVDNSIKDPEIFVTNNVLGTQRLLDLALKFETPRFLHISTDEVYGSLGFDDPSTTESSPLEPNNPYSASKAGADCLVRSYQVTYKMPCLITRSSNNFGPYQYPEKFIPVILSKALKNQKIPVYGQGQNMRDWIFVLDNCRAVDLVRRKGLVGEIYNIPGYKEITNIDLVKAILKVLDKAEDLIEFVEDRKGHDLRYSMDGSKISKLGFSYATSFEESLLQTIEWYKTHPAFANLEFLSSF